MDLSKLKKVVAASEKKEKEKALAKARSSDPAEGAAAKPSRDAARRASVINGSQDGSGTDKKTMVVQRVTDEIEWFTRKFDYRNDDKPWGNSRDAVERSLNKLRGHIVDGK